jgi:hypothetical protein
MGFVNHEHLEMDAAECTRLLRHRLIGGHTHVEAAFLESLLLHGTLLQRNHTAHAAYVGRASVGWRGVGWRWVGGAAWGGAGWVALVGWRGVGWRGVGWRRYGASAAVVSFGRVGCLACGPLGADGCGALLSSPPCCHGASVL